MSQNTMYKSESTVNTYGDDKIQQSTERAATPEEVLRTEVLEDDGEVFKSNTGHGEFRALGW